VITVDFSKLRIRSGARILDIGCGTGRHMGEALRHAGVHVTGMDRNFQDLNTARDRMNYQKDLGVCCGDWALGASDITELPFPDECFDLVICSEVLEHIPNQTGAVSEIVRVLKPGRDLVVSVPRYLPEQICWRLSTRYRNTPGGHIRIYRRRELTDLLARAGVRPWHIHWAHGLHTPYWWLKCFIGIEKTDAPPVKLYHRLLVWEIMHRPRVLQVIEKLLNPVLGKSMVVYLNKPTSFLAG
jgi:ubiquinone/menaquinone biosynthesis C-methylase UbiE